MRTKLKFDNSYEWSIKKKFLLFFFTGVIFFGLGNYISFDLPYVCKFESDYPFRVTEHSDWSISIKELNYSFLITILIFLINHMSDLDSVNEIGENFFGNIDNLKPEPIHYIKYPFNTHAVKEPIHYIKDPFNTHAVKDAYFSKLKNNTPPSWDSINYNNMFNYRTTLVTFSYAAFRDTYNLLYNRHARFNQNIVVQMNNIQTPATFVRNNLRNIMLLDNVNYTQAIDNLLRSIIDARDSNTLRTFLQAIGDLDITSFRVLRESLFNTHLLNNPNYRDVSFIMNEINQNIQGQLRFGFRRSLEWALRRLLEETFVNYRDIFAQQVDWEWETGNTNSFVRAYLSNHNNIVNNNPGLVDQFRRINCLIQQLNLMIGTDARPAHYRFNYDDQLRLFIEIIVLNGNQLNFNTTLPQNIHESFIVHSRGLDYRIFTQRMKLISFIGKLALYSHNSRI